MNRARAAIIALAVAAAAIAGVFAVGRSLALGSQARTSTNAQVARRTAQLDRYQASLAKALSKQPPPLPPLPTAVATSGSRAVSSARIVYRRPHSVVVRGNSRSGEDVREPAGEGADD